MNVLSDMIELRPYQKQIVESLRQSVKNGNNRILMVSPTGSGKTILFTYMASNHLKRGGRVLILTHRSELLNQTNGAFTKFGLKPELITAGSKPDLTGGIHVAMVETLFRRADEYAHFIASRSMIVMDECHLESFTKIFPYIADDTHVIGATATPHRKASQNCLSEFYTDMVQEVDTPDLIEQGFLCDVRTYGVPIKLSGLKKVGDDYDTKKYYEDNKVYKGVVDNYLRIVAGKKTIVFASNVDSSKQVCEEFNNRGIKAMHIDGYTPDAKRTEILNWFKTDPCAVLCNCGILTAGYDEPSIEAVILYRATTSLPLYLQMVGRGSRTNEGKEAFYLLDFGNNVKRFDLWESPRIWSLHKELKKTKREGAAPVKDCKNCGAMVPVSSTECPYCKNVFPAKEKYDKDEVVELMKIPKSQLMIKSDIREKVKLVKSGVLKAFYVLHNITDYREAKMFCKLMGYKEGFEFENQYRFKVFRDAIRK